MARSLTIASRFSELGYQLSSHRRSCAAVVYIIFGVLVGFVLFSEFFFVVSKVTGCRLRQSVWVLQASLRKEAAEDAARWKDQAEARDFGDLRRCAVSFILF